MPIDDDEEWDELASIGVYLATIACSAKVFAPVAS